MDKTADDTPFDAADFYCAEEFSETFSHTLVDDAIAEYVDDWVEIDWDEEEECFEFSHEEVTIYAYTRKSVSEREMRWAAEAALDEVLERFHEEYGNPDESYVPSDALEEAAKVFVAAVVRDYKVWQCDQVASRTYDLHEWVEKNKPELLKRPER